MYIHIHENHSERREWFLPVWGTGIGNTLPGNNLEHSWFPQEVKFEYILCSCISQFNS